MWEIPNRFVQSIRDQPWAQNCREQDFWKFLLEWIKDVLLPEFLVEISGQVDEITEIDPDCSDQEILSMATHHMVDFLGAVSASVRIYDPATEQMLSYGSYPPEEESRETYIPLTMTLAGEVVRTGRTYLVPNILFEELYQDKERVMKKGAYSVMAVPMSFPRLSPYEAHTMGVIQLYYQEKDKLFLPLEIKMAELMARRLSFVMARKRILSLYRINEKKETIVQKIFLKLGSREGVKMKEVFNRVVPELADIISLQSCALFAVTEDEENVFLEAGYPDTSGYHGIGKSFPIESEPAFKLVLRREDYESDSPYEILTPSYMLIIDPLKSRYISGNMKAFARDHNINSILYVPLTVGEGVTHFMTFDAREQRKRYTEGEIEIFVFLGRELMKAQRMERLDDILHDFKNPAIATAGFARRLKRLIEGQESLQEAETIRKYTEILLVETSRLQEMALSIYQVGKEQVVNLTSILINRFDINSEAIKEMLKQNVTVKEGPYHDPLYVRCYPLHLERILDNLLNNATNAIPLKGGTLTASTFLDNGWACVEITNTGLIPEEERRRLLQGEGRGRGIYITYRIVRLLRGQINITAEKNSTKVTVRFPLASSPDP
ncbi:MAG: GAF domain-containing sensor histidine kinase [Deltaproteobacteria bacterium]|nr:GAF domain-containing sensor histidine kinase [Deltaproteobacteria bacterium]